MGSIKRHLRAIYEITDLYLPVSSHERASLSGILSDIKEKLLHLTPVGNYAHGIRFTIEDQLKIVKRYNELNKDEKERCPLYLDPKKLTEASSGTENKVLAPVRLAEALPSGIEEKVVLDEA
jgi:hypothetical protein